jgi:hypothetical protein
MEQSANSMTPPRANQPISRVAARVVAGQLPLITRRISQARGRAPVPRCKQRLLHSIGRDLLFEVPAAQLVRAYDQPSRSTGRRRIASLVARVTLTPSGARDGPVA